ncbi:P-II family nitrogen regulator [Listeria booriae]|uniref:P-II family nitrogen regulator n=1 Tax=Listeria booriae TaxID=1552123 RepID=UPI0016236B8A|nr:P-II family nitrogen regulator [Listeria booriae]MBC2168444.1 P-II family nitrogen regulator [Listeria booriae]
MSNLTKIEIITRPNRFYEFQKALAEIGVSGLTVTKTLGTGLEKGLIELYRGKKKENNIHERMKIEIVVSTVPVEDVLEVVKKTLRTGEPGDGKVFIYPLAEVVKISTGERGVDALQDHPK